MWLACDALEFHRGQMAQSGLPASAMLRPLDPDHDREAHLLTSSPRAAVEDVLLRQAEERFHRGVVTAGRSRPVEQCCPARLYFAIPGAVAAVGSGRFEFPAVWQDRKLPVPGAPT